MSNGLILLAVDGDALAHIRPRLLAAGFDVVGAGDFAAAMAELHRVELDVALIDLALPGRSGLDVLSAARHLSPETEVVVLAEHFDVPTAVDCIRRGAFDLLTKPIEVDALVLTISRAIERRSLRATTTLFRASQEILRDRDPANLPATIVELAARVLEADDVTLSLYGLDGRLRECHSWSGVPESRAVVTREVGVNVIGGIAERGAPVLLPDDTTAPLPSGVVLDRIRSCIVFPLASGPRTLGVLTLSRITDHRPYRRVDLERTGVLASQAVLAMENTALMGRMVEAERLATVGHLAAGVAHEINNPLTYVTANAESALDCLALLKNDMSAEASCAVRQRALRTIDYLEAALHDVCDGALRIAAIARDLRALSRAENPTREAVDLSAAVRSAQRMTAPRLRSTATVTADLAADAVVLGDEGRLVQVFVNLIVNAAQAAAGRPVAIHLATRKDGDRLIATVRDDGPGIAPEIAARIFQPFFSTKPAAKGTGLGLSLSQGIAAEHGGTLTVDSRPGAGATFVLSLPARAACVSAIIARTRADDAA